MIIEHKNSTGRGIFLAKEADMLIGEMSYAWISPDCFVIDHTEVSPNYQGQGIGAQLVKNAVEYAHENNFTIIPQCPFARAEFSRHPVYEKVRKK